MMQVSGILDDMTALAGLDHAILGGINSEGERADAKRIAELLKHGAHALGAMEERAVEASTDFANEARSLQRSK